MNPTDLDSIEFLIDDFLITHYKDEDKRLQLKESLVPAIESKKYKLLAGIVDDTPLGFGVIRSSDRHLTMLHALEGMWDDLLSQILHHLKTIQPVVYIFGKFIPEFLYEDIINAGFTRYDRPSMSIPYNVIKSLNQIALPKGFSIVPYDPDTKTEIATVLFESYADTSLPIIFPDFFGSLEGCQNCLEMWIQSGSILILTSDEGPIGICAIGFHDTTFHIRNLSLKPSYRRKGLGKALLILSLQDFVDKDGEYQSVTLEVNKGDAAYHLYKSLGFTTDNYTSRFVWTKKE